MPRGCSTCSVPAWRDWNSRVRRVALEHLVDEAACRLGAVIAQQQVTAHGGDVNRGLSLFANFTVHDKATNVVDNYQQVGLVYKGAFDARPKDDIGFGVARIHVNDDVKKRAELLNGQSGINDYDNPGFVPLQRTEYNAELYYGFHVTNWLTVRPNLQYIKSPGGVDEVDNALVAGLKIQSSF